MSNISDLFKGGTVLSSSSLISQMLSFFVLPWTMLHFSPAEFGINGVLILITMLCSSFITLSTEVLVFSKQSKLHSIKIIIGNIVRCFAVLISIGLLSGLLTYSNSIGYWGLVLPCSALQAIYLNLYYINNKFGNYKMMGCMTVINSICTSIFPNAIYEYGVFSLFIGYMLGLTISIIINYRFVVFSINHRNKKFKIEYKGIYIFFQNSLDYFNATLSALMLTRFYGVEFYGMYTLALRVLNAPLSFISSSVSQIYAKKISQNRTKKVFNIFMTIIVIMSISGYLFIGLFIYFGTGLVPERWLMVSNYIYILSFGYVFKFIASSLSHTPVVFNALKNNAKLTLFGTLITLFIILISGFVGVDVVIMLVLLSIFYFVYYLICVLWFGRLVTNNEKKSN